MKPSNYTKNIQSSRRTGRQGKKSGVKHPSEVSTYGRFWRPFSKLKNFAKRLRRWCEPMSDIQFEHHTPGDIMGDLQQALHDVLKRGIQRGHIVASLSIGLDLLPAVGRLTTVMREFSIAMAA